MFENDIKKSHLIQKTWLFVSHLERFNFYFFSTRCIKRSFAKHPELQKWARPTFQTLTKVKVTLKAVWNSNFQHLIQREILMMCKLNFSGLWNIKGNLENLQSLANPFSGIRHGSIFKLSQNTLKIGRKYRFYRIFNRCGGCVYIRVVQYFMYIRVKGTLRVLNCFRKYGSRRAPLYFFSAAIAAGERWILHQIHQTKSSLQSCL